MALEVEQKYFDGRKDEFFRTYLGQFVLIKDDQLVGAYTTAAQAYAAALQKFGNVPVLIKQVTEEGPSNYLALAFGLL